MPVPSRGWNDPVRVCDSCKSKLMKSSANNEDNVPQGILLTLSIILNNKLLKSFSQFVVIFKKKKKPKLSEILPELNSSSGSNQFDSEAANVRVRKYGEVVLSTINSVASVLEYPKG
jgi:zinc finger FYVE domain-containing protein 1